MSNQSIINVDLHTRTALKLQFFDTNLIDLGDYSKEIKKYLVIAHIVIICYSVKSKPSFFNAINKWYKLVNTMGGDHGILLCGLKADGALKKRNVTFKEGYMAAKSRGLSFMEVSSWERKNTESLVQTITNLAYNIYVDNFYNQTSWSDILNRFYDIVFLKNILGISKLPEIDLGPLSDSSQEYSSSSDDRSSNENTNESEQEFDEEELLDGYGIFVKRQPQEKLIEENSDEDDFDEDYFDEEKYESNASGFGVSLVNLNKHRKDNEDNEDEDDDEDDDIDEDDEESEKTVLERISGGSSISGKKRVTVRSRNYSDAYKSHLKNEITKKEKKETRGSEHLHTLNLNSVKRKSYGRKSKAISRVFKRELNSSFHIMALDGIEGTGLVDELIASIDHLHMDASLKTNKENEISGKKEKKKPNPKPKKEDNPSKLCSVM